MARSTLIVALALGIAARGATGQGTPAADTAGTATCDSVFARARADTASVALTAYVQRPSGEQLPLAPADQILGAIATQLELPSPLRLPVLGPGPAKLRAFAVRRRGDSTSLRSAVLNGVYGFGLQRDGSVTNVRVRLAAIAPGVDSAVVRAIREAAAIGAMPHGSRDVAGPVELRLAAGVEGRGRAHPIARAVVWRLPVTDAVAPREVPVPVYPADEREAEWEGNVVLQFVVDPEGEPRVETLEVLQSTTPGFARAAVAIVPKLRYTPARVGRCAVWQLVRLDVPFTLVRK